MRESDEDVDSRAVARYRHLLRTASPDVLERAHEDAFTRLTAEQRRRLLDELAAHASAAERGDDAGSLARLATRAESRDPGILERTWAGPSFGGTFLAFLAGAVIGTVAAHDFFAADAAAAEADAGAEGDAAAGGDNASFGGDEELYPGEIGGAFDDAAGGFDVDVDLGEDLLGF